MAGQNFITLNAFNPPRMSTRQSGALHCLIYINSHLHQFTIWFECLGLQGILFVFSLLSRSTIHWNTEMTRERIIFISEPKDMLLSLQRRLSKWAYFCIQPSSSSKYSSDVLSKYVYCIVLYRTSCRKPYFLRYRQLEVGGVTMYDKGWTHKY